MCDVPTPSWVLHGPLSGRNVKCTNNTDPTCPQTHRWVEKWVAHTHVQYTHSYTHVGTHGSLRRCTSCLSIYFSSRQRELWIGKFLTRGPDILQSSFLWEWSVSLGKSSTQWQHFPLHLDVIRKKRKKERAKKGRKQPFLFRKCQNKAKKPVKQ